MAVWDTMLVYLMWSSSFSLSLALPGMSASGIDLGKLLVLGSNFRLVLSSILGSRLAVISYSMVQLTSQTSSHLPTIAKVDIGKFLGRLQVVLLVFIISMFSVFGVLWSTQCSMSKGITPSGSWNVSKCNLDRLLVSGTLGVFISTTEIDIGGKVTFPLVLSIGLVVAWQMIWAIISPLIVM